MRGCLRVCENLLVVGGGSICVRVWLDSRSTRICCDVSLVWVRVVLLVVVLAMLPLCIGEGGRVICGVDLPLVSRGRELTRVVHIVSVSIVVRQRGLDAWIPPERSALNGRRSVDGNNVRYGAPRWATWGGGEESTFMVGVEKEECWL